MKYLFILFLFPAIIAGQSDCQTKIDSLSQVIWALEKRLPKDDSKYSTVSIYLDGDIRSEFGWQIAVDGRPRPLLASSTDRNIRFKVKKGERKISICRPNSDPNTGGNYVSSCTERYFYIEDRVTIFTAGDFGLRWLMKE